MQVIKKVSGASKLDILYLMFVVMSGIFWQERIINQDNALFAFNITAFESFELAHYRFTDIFSQIIPILLVKAGLDLQTILSCYSILLVLLPYLLFRIVLYTFSDKGMAWMLFLAQILFVSDYFFDAISESKGAIALSLFCIAILKNKVVFKHIYFYYGLGIIALTFALFTHPVSLVLIAILLLWSYVNKLMEKKDTYLFFGLIAVVSILKYFFFPTSGYENGMINEVLDVSKWAEVLKENYVLTFISSQFRKIYLFGFLFLLLFFFRYIRYGKTKTALLYLALNMGMFFLLLITFKQGDSNMMMEKNLSTLAVTILLPFIGKEADSLNVFNSFRVRFFLPFLCLFLLHRINKASAFYTERQNTLNKWIEIGKDYGHQKYLINQEALSNTPEISIWSLPYETALISTLKYPENSITIKNIKEVEYWRGLHNHKDAFIGADFFMPYNTKKIKSNLYNFGEEKYYLLEINK